MGQACFSSAEAKEERKRSKEVDRQLKQDSKSASAQYKLLLLGPGESGKSTIFKQVQIIHQRGFDEEQRESSKKFVYRNIVQNMQTLLEAVHKWGYQLSPENVERAAKVSRVSVAQWNSEIGEDCAALWKDSAIQEAYERRNLIHLSDSAQYFFGEIDRIMAPGYLPNDQDVLRIRIPTTGIVENKWTVDNKCFTILDMGGQRSERRKWMHQFDNVTAILYVASLSDYNQLLYEDDQTNRMRESIQLFDSICNNELFKHTPIILFLNKTDLFREKIKQYPLSDYFPSFTGGDDYDLGLEFIEDKFCSVCNSDTRSIYVRTTCATDTNNMKFVFDATTDIILRARLQHLNLL